MRIFQPSLAKPTEAAPPGPSMSPLGVCTMPLDTLSSSSPSSPSSSSSSSPSPKAGADPGASLPRARAAASLIARSQAWRLASSDARMW